MGSSWVPFRYAGFYDVPERILISYRDYDFLFEPYFDHEADECENFYYGYDVAGCGPNNSDNVCVVLSGDDQLLALKGAGRRENPWKTKVLDGLFVDRSCRILVRK